MHLEPILSHYSPAVDGLHWVPVAGGFSGANVWRGDDPTGIPAFALKAWPTEMTAARLATIHRWMTQAAHLPFMPMVLRTKRGQTLVSQGDRNWDITRWMPGEPLANPSIAEVEAACEAIARLHLAWPTERNAVCPGVQNRLRILGDFRERFGTGIGSLLVSEALRPLVRQAWEVVAARVAWAEQLLRPWENVAVSLRPCVRDLRSEHVLFSQGTVSGIVDFGAMAVDHPAVDLARFLGDVAEDEPRFAAGLRSYRGLANFDEPDEFVRVLRHTGTVCSVIGWLVRLTVRGAIGEESVTNRLGELIKRVERFAPR